MRNVLLCSLLVLAGAVTIPALAEDLSLHVENGKGSLVWHDAGRTLVMASGDQHGIRVIDARPEGVLGLRTADTILAVDGHAVNDISAMLDSLHASHSASAQLLLRRDGTQQLVTVATRDYMRFMPPKPPAPPAPPPPPAPPTGE